MDWTDRVRRGFEGVSPTPDDDVIAELAEHAAAIHEAALGDGDSPEDAARRVAAAIDRWRDEASALTRPVRRPPAVAPPPHRTRQRGGFVTPAVHRCGHAAIGVLRRGAVTKCRLVDRGGVLRQLGDHVIVGRRRRTIEATADAISPVHDDSSGL